MSVDETIVIDGELRVMTDHSVWLIRHAEYCRLPRREGPRYVPSAALEDARWHPHVGVWRVEDDLGVRIRLLPAGRPDGAYGIVTGDIVASTPDMTSPANAVATRRAQAMTGGGRAEGTPGRGWGQAPMSM